MRGTVHDWVHASGLTEQKWRLSGGGEEGFMNFPGDIFAALTFFAWDIDNKLPCHHLYSGFSCIFFLKKVPQWLLRQSLSLFCRFLQRISIKWKGGNTQKYLVRKNRKTPGDILIPLACINGIALISGASITVLSFTLTSLYWTSVADTAWQVLLFTVCCWINIMTGICKIGRPLLKALSPCSIQHS